MCLYHPLWIRQSAEPRWSVPLQESLAALTYLKSETARFKEEHPEEWQKALEEGKVSRSGQAGLVTRPQGDDSSPLRGFHHPSLGVWWSCTFGGATLWAPIE